ncbi:hypothetical protein G7061_04070 [Erysipelothrix sp. HDW6B]|uniref:hypothetical protein n=1 Tax=Erysipelothrix sp. HDW6B TaxID=2714929 RepID=UPI00140B01AB|nr:hypothetical protein [Erysipelothrix sp. HDW6B]QIK85831.1 hypothetical protein G7061_04070 [Erysipelothrix sp. HDW6B]
MYNAVVRYSNGFTQELINVSKVTTYVQNGKKITHDIKTYISDDVTATVYAILSENGKYVIFDKSLLLDIQFYKSN